MLHYPMSSNQFEVGSRGSTRGLNDDPSLKSTWCHRAWVTFGCTAVLATLIKAAVLWPASGWVGPTIACLVAYLFADFGSGVYHWAIDNYGDASTPVFGPQIEGFVGHHHQPRKITKCEFANNMHSAACATGVIILIPLALVGNCEALAFAGILGGFVIFSQQFHAWAHASASEVPHVVAMLQRLGILISPMQHAAHHRPKHATNYCIISGLCNEFLDNWKVFRALEMVVFSVFGVRPRSWGDMQES